MATDHRARVEEMLAQYRRSREQLGAVQRELATIEESARSDDGTVRVTVGPQGVLTGLEVSEEAYRKHHPGHLASLIVGLVGEAARAATVRSGAVLEPVLPPGTDPSAVLEGRGDLEPEDRDHSGDSHVNDREAVRPSSSEALEDEPEPDGHSWLQDSVSSPHIGTRGTRP